MKKVLALSLVLLALMSAFCFNVSAEELPGPENKVSVYLNGFEVIFDVPARLIGDRTMVPIRRIAEVLDCEVKWSGDTSKIIITRNTDKLELTIGKNELYKNDRLHYVMDTCPIIIEEAGESRTLVPLRALSEAFGCTVDWDSENRRALVRFISEDTIVGAGDHNITRDLFDYFATNITLNYQGTPKITENDDEVKLLEDHVLNSLYQLCAVKKMASSFGISIYDPVITESIDNALNEYKNYYGENFETILKQSHMTENVFKEMLYTTFFENTISEISEAKAMTASADVKTYELYKYDEFIRAAHILVESEDVANVLLEKAKIANEEELFALAKEYSIDTGLISNPEGYYFLPGEMVVEFENAAFDLRENETSGIVKTDYGYHIIRRLPKNYDYILKNISDFFSKYLNYRYLSSIEDYARSLAATAEKYESYNKIDFFREYVLPAQKMLSET